MQRSIILYKTGRTNANDGGIDFVMRPLGRFFQVTETLDVKKYFLDIEKTQKFPLTFVVKSEQSEEYIRNQLQVQAERTYGVTAIVNRYMEAIEEVINSPKLLSFFDKVLESGKLRQVMDEIILQSRLEFNYNEDDFEDNIDDG